MQYTSLSVMMIITLIVETMSDFMSNYTSYASVIHVPV